MRYRVALLLVAVAIFLGIVLAALRLPALFYLNQGSIDINRASTYWGIVLRIVGPTRAEAEMEREGNQLPAFQSHLLAHTFGAALYAQHGEEGFRFCTSAFAYGCYHELSGLAIAHLGTANLDAFVSSCRQLPENDQFGCMHGLGHGVVANRGYSLPQLLESLKDCHAIDPAIIRNGCTDGAIMEYELRIMAEGVGNIDPRPFTEETALSPCDAVPSIDRSACYFEASSWWLSAMPEKSGIVRLREFARLCGLISSGTDHNACIEGSGFWLASALDFNIDSIRRACEVVSSGNKKDALACLSNAARRFRAMHRADVDTVCMRLGLLNGDLAYCNAVTHSTPKDDSVSAESKQ